MPAGSKGATYSPFASVVRLAWRVPCAWLVIVTVAPGMASPWGSATRPAIVPVVICAAPIATGTSSSQARQTKTSVARGRKPPRGSVML